MLLGKALLVSKYQKNLGSTCTSHLSVSKELTEWRQSVIIQLMEVREKDTQGQRDSFFLKKKATELPVTFWQEQCSHGESKLEQDGGSISGKWYGSWVQGSLQQIFSWAWWDPWTADHLHPAVLQTAVISSAWPMATHLLQIHKPHVLTASHRYKILFHAATSASNLLLRTYIWSVRCGEHCSRDCLWGHAGAGQILSQLRNQCTGACKQCWRLPCPL